MRNKFLVYSLINDERSEMEFKTLRDVAKYYNLEYHHVRSLYLQSRDETKKKFLHPFLMTLIKKLQVIDNPNQYSF